MLLRKVCVGFLLAAFFIQLTGCAGGHKTVVRGQSHDTEVEPSRLERLYVKKVEAARKASVPVAEAARKSLVFVGTAALFLAWWWLDGWLDSHGGGQDWNDSSFDGGN